MILKCEKMVQVCPGGEQICLYGSECVARDKNGSLEYTCDCNSIHAPFHKYTGNFCELQSTELCTYNGRPGQGLAKDAFCVNAGRCKGHVNDKQT